MSGRDPDFWAEILKDEAGGWEWAIYKSVNTPRGKELADHRGRGALYWRESIHGRTATKRGARSEARRALRNLQRYLTRADPEVVR